MLCLHSYLTHAVVVVCLPHKGTTLHAVLSRVQEGDLPNSCMLYSIALVLHHSMYSRYQTNAVQAHDDFVKPAWPGFISGGAFAPPKNWFAPLEV